MTSIIALDADVVIYAAIDGHPLGSRVVALFDGPVVGLGSVLLLTETLAKPLRLDPTSQESTEILQLLSRLDLRAFDAPTARLALGLAVKYRLRGADSAHLATAVAAGADQFITNNRRDFPKSISEIDIVYPDDLPTATAA